MMKTHSTVSGLILILASAPWALAIPAQRGPAGGAAATPAATMTCDCPAPGQGLRQGKVAGNCPDNCGLSTADTTPLTLSAAARQALLFQIDEERMAGELYAAFGAKWGLMPFAKIPQAEARHESVLRQLATRAGLTLPTAVAGRFDDAEVQKRYDALLALGLESADSALRVGAYVEEVDIADLNTLVATTDSAALLAAAKSLQTASGHHLAAFVGQLSARGITYAPQVLTAEDYQAMLAAGGRGRGAGSGQGQGWGRRAGRG
jgi:hypothetical protein